MMNIRTIARNVGVALIFDALFMFLSVIVSALNGYDESFSPLLLGCILTFTAGIFPIIFEGKSENISTKEGLAIILLAWVLSCVFGMIPYALYGGELSFIEAWFESVSGFTTTGATILRDIESLPAGLLFWRSSTHYIVGLGVVLFMVLILPSYGSVKMKISKMDVSDVSKDNFNFKTNEYVKVVLWVYSGLTAISFLLYHICGMSAFDALNHAFSTAATGGFSTKNASLGYYHSRSIELVAMVMMVISSLHFGLIYSSIVGLNFKVFKNTVTKFYLQMIMVFGFLVGLNLYFSGQFHSFGDAIWNGYFNVASLSSSTGFANCDTSVWPLFSKFILIYFCIQCGCSGSTTSGVKADRMWVMFNAMRAQLSKTFHPNAVVPVKLGNKVADKDMVYNIILYLLTFFCVMFVCMMIYAAIGMDLPASISSSVSMIANVGPGFGSVGSYSNFASVPNLAKFVMSLEMITGRLGLFSVLIIFRLFRRG